MSNTDPSGREAARISKVARRLLSSGLVGDPSLRRTAKVLNALQVLAPNGPLNSWLAPIVVGDRLAAFLQLLPDGTMMRFSSFQRRPGDVESCPAAADWLDRDRIRSRAVALQRRGERAGEPFLTYDRVPDRLVWAVPATSPGGELRYVFVAGESVYTPHSGEAVG